MKIFDYNEDNLEVMKRLSDESIDVICIDPPYLYLKGQKLERPFDEQKFFEECKRLLTKNGFMVMFGRGSNSTGEAVYNLFNEYPEIDFEYIGTEIDKEYFDEGKERLDKVVKGNGQLKIAL